MLFHFITMWASIEYKIKIVKFNLFMLPIEMK